MHHSRHLASAVAHSPFHIAVCSYTDKASETNEFMALSNHRKTACIEQAKCKEGQKYVEPDANKARARCDLCDKCTTQIKPSHYDKGCQAKSGLTCPKGDKIINLCSTTITASCKK
jgi:hypothetical protein